MKYQNLLGRQILAMLLSVCVSSGVSAKESLSEYTGNTVKTAVSEDDKLSVGLKEILYDEKYGVPGIGVAVAKNGKIIYSHTFGNRYIDEEQPENNLPLNKETKVRIASISKTFTAVAYMQLAEQGKIDLDDDVSKYLGFKLQNPNYPDIPITSRMLLSHTSSIRDGEVYAIAPNYSISEFFTPQGKFYEEGAHFAPYGEVPGEYFCYTNLNYGILATIIEKVTGIRFDEYVRQMIFVPMDIKASYNIADFKSDELYDLSVVYQKYHDDLSGSGRWQPQIDDYYNGSTTAYDLSEYKIGTNGTVFSPQGGLRISLLDLEKWLLMFLNDGKYQGKTILSKKTVDEMFTPYWVLNSGKTNGDTYGGLMCCYGLGIHNMLNIDKDRFLPDRDIVMAGHFGEAYGLLAGMFLDRKNKQGFIYFINGTEAPLDRYMGAYSGMYIWEEKICSAILNTMFSCL